MFKQWRKGLSFSINVGWRKPVEKPKIRNGEALTSKFDLAQDETRNSQIEIQQYVTWVNGVYT